ncbi:carbohydrate ABC transporter permease [Lacrimispora saccharolytica]|uniref:Binding-protein-dependent transport systems inner membrane component n=1 Tax=Lacrimispora saccharolytica (strain ATCC 35040 / DSM 2544 / NRCC 2533 / WM1) TaxID=610130 RepID=D9R9T7_LACSW|nr:carbohydrate ABC transporter permease [Lacrimispora saccharolytica]ADL04137.1 binding-protein-dependent transport systems inner membrane component [[Clostridium] saccharolyticum WM1]QRV21574.1 carbohydrate ABC transporter permease [Lacrimispora saccharolytica]
MKHKKIKAGSIVLTLLSAGLAVMFLAPVIWAFFVSLQYEGKQIKSVVSWFSPPYTLGNYLDLIIGSDVAKWLLNSVIVAVLVTVLTILFSSMAAYALSKIKFMGRNKLYFYFLLGLMVPGEATIVPLFITANSMHLIDSYAGLLLPSVAVSMNLIIMVTFFKGIPDSLIEAARIDGAGELTIFARIIMPLSKAVLSTISIFAFIGSWNNYLWPLLCAMDSSKFTLPVGIPIFAGTYTVDYVKPMTANMIASIPAMIIYLIFEKQIVQGITMSGVKG